MQYKLSDLLNSIPCLSLTKFSYTCVLATPLFRHSVTLDERRTVSSLALAIRTLAEVRISNTIHHCPGMELTPRTCLPDTSPRIACVPGPTLTLRFRVLRLVGVAGCHISSDLIPLHKGEVQLKVHPEGKRGATYANFAVLIG